MRCSLWHWILTWNWHRSACFWRREPQPRRTGSGVRAQVSDALSLFIPSKLLQKHNKLSWLKMLQRLFHLLLCAVLFWLFLSVDLTIHSNRSFYPATEKQQQQQQQQEKWAAVTSGRCWIETRDLCWSRDRDDMCASFWPNETEIFMHLSPYLSIDENYQTCCGSNLMGISRRWIIGGWLVGKAGSLNLDNRVVLSSVWVLKFF